MSVVAWDGKTLAADRRASYGNLILTTTKIFRVRDHLCGYTGEADAGSEVLEWFRSGASPSIFPPRQRETDRFATLLVVAPDGVVMKYERTPYPVRFEDRLIASGSGRDFALMAMRLGKTATEAVQLTMEFDCNCGNGVDALTLR